MTIFGLKPWVNPFGKMSIFRLFECLDYFFYSLERHFFLLEYRKRYFPRLLLPKKKKVKKMIIFAQKPWLNPFGKMSVFRLFERLVFIALKGAFSL